MSHQRQAAHISLEWPSVEEEEEEEDRTGKDFWLPASLLLLDYTARLPEPKAQALELGSGKGLVGLLLASLWRQRCVSQPSIILTDFNRFVLKALQRSSEANKLHEQVTIEALDWKQASHYSQRVAGSDLVIGSDVLYSRTSAQPLADVIALLSPGAVFLMSHTLRFSITGAHRARSCTDLVPCAYHDQAPCAAKRSRTETSEPSDCSVISALYESSDSVLAKFLALCTSRRLSWRMLSCCRVDTSASSDTSSLSQSAVCEPPLTARSSISVRGTGAERFQVDFAWNPSDSDSDTQHPAVCRVVRDHSSSSQLITLFPSPGDTSASLSASALSPSEKLRGSAELEGAFSAAAGATTTACPTATAAATPMAFSLHNPAQEHVILLAFSRSRSALMDLPRGVPEHWEADFRSRYQ